MKDKSIRIIKIGINLFYGLILILNIIARVFGTELNKSPELHNLLTDYQLWIFIVLLIIFIFWNKTKALAKIVRLQLDTYFNGAVYTYILLSLLSYSSAIYLFNYVENTNASGNSLVFDQSLVPFVILGLITSSMSIIFSAKIAKKTKMITLIRNLMFIVSIITFAIILLIFSITVVTNNFKNFG